jgi:RluA family pseudouridine synthase
VSRRQGSAAILHEDEAILAVDKPSGVAVIPEAWRRDTPCLARSLEGQWGRLWVVHRIDRDTSGVVVFARSAEAHRCLNDQFAEHRVRKVYHLLARGVPTWEETVIDAPLRPDGDARHRTVLDRGGGKAAETSFRVLERFASHALLEACPRTGRTHQIRVHAALSGHPIVADPLYGDGEALLLSSFKRPWKGDPGAEHPLLDRTALHAVSLEILHPSTGERLEITSPRPRDLEVALTQLSRYSRR